MTPERFAELMGGLLCATNHKMDAKGIEVWRRILADIDDASLSRAFHRAACECKGWPTPALIREYAAAVECGEVATLQDVWPSVLKAVRHFGIYGKAEAKKAIPADVWKCLGGNVGWEWLCEMEPDQRAAYAAQFRDRYREHKAREERDRRLPESLRPRIDNTPVRGLPEPKPEPLALPAPPQPSADQVAAAKLRVFRDAPEAAVIDDAAIESRRQNQIAALKQMGAAS